MEGFLTEPHRKSPEGAAAEFTGERVCTASRQGAVKQLPALRGGERVPGAPRRGDAELFVMGRIRHECR
jgi:hypothetical protein